MLKKVNRIEVKNQKKRPKKRKLWIARIFNHECYVTYLTSFYSCQWNTELEKKSECAPCYCSWREQLFYPFLVIAFCMSVVLLLVWIETSNEYNGFDWVVYLITRYWYVWSLLLLSLFGILVAYSSLLLVLGFLLIWEGYELYLHWCHKVVSSLCMHHRVYSLSSKWWSHRMKPEAMWYSTWFLSYKPAQQVTVLNTIGNYDTWILTVLVIGVCTFFMTVLCEFWNDRWLTLGLSLKIFAPYIHLSSITVMVLLSWPVAFYLVRWEQEAIQVAIGLPFFLILFCLFVVPLGIYSPCLQEKDELGPKPGLFGHRGAPMLGPENTMMSFEKAVEHGAFGLESDVYISCDGVPFLMHDYDLRRTTNIGEIMPNASNTTSHFFYWDFLSTLNAGRWFVQSQLKPFYNMEPLSEADREKARNQKIPKLSDLLELAQKQRKIVIFDLNNPPGKHPFRNTFIHQVVRVILDSKIEQHLIYWLPGSHRTYVKWKAPGFQQVGRLNPIEVLERENISIINVDYKRLFHNGLRDYKAANITINLYLVNEPWLFSLAWCSRIHSVTTDNIQLLRQINHPYYSMTPTYYKFMWFLMDIVSTVFIFAIFYFHWWRESQKEKVFESTSGYTGTESIRLEKRKSKKRALKNVPVEPPPRVAEIPWTVRPLYPALPKSRRPTLQQSPRRKTTNQSQSRKPSNATDVCKDDTSQLRPRKDSDSIQTPTWEATRKATLQKALFPLKVNERTISSTEVPHSETQPKRTSTIESPQESSLLFPTTSIMSSSGLSSKKN